MGHIDPTKEVFAQFRANDRPGPIHMLNLVRLRAEAAYPDGRKATGAEAYAAYGRESGPVFERLGGRIVWQGRFELMLIGPQEERWDHCFIAEYPSRGGVRRNDPRSRLSGSGQASPGRRRGFPPDPACGAAGRQDVWGDTEVGRLLARPALAGRAERALDDIDSAAEVPSPGRDAPTRSPQAGRGGRCASTYAQKQIGGPEGPPIVLSNESRD